MFIPDVAQEILQSVGMYPDAFLKLQTCSTLDQKNGHFDIVEAYVELLVH